MTHVHVEVGKNIKSVAVDNGFTNLKSICKNGGYLYIQPFFYSIRAQHAVNGYRLKHAIPVPKQALPQ
jgi:hypothetical protein